MGQRTMSHVCILWRNENELLNLVWKCSLEASLLAYSVQRSAYWTRYRVFSGIKDSDLRAQILFILRLRGNPVVVPGGLFHRYGV